MCISLNKNLCYASRHIWKKQVFLYLKFGHTSYGFKSNKSKKKKKNFSDFLPVRDKQRATMRMPKFG